VFHQEKNVPVARMKIIRFYVINLLCQLCQREELPEDSLERRERS